MSKRVSKVLILAGVVLPLLGAPTIAFSIDPAAMAKINHIIECAGWLVSDPAKHAQFCVPSHVTEEQIKAVMQPGLVLTGGTTDSCYEGGGAGGASTSYYSSYSSEYCDK